MSGREVTSENSSRRSIRVFIIAVIGAWASSTPSFSEVRLLGQVDGGTTAAQANGVQEENQVALVREDGDQCYDEDGVLGVLNPFNFDAKVGAAGMGIYPASALEMRRRNHLVRPVRPARSLSAREKAALRPVFGDLVDEVRVTYNAVLLTQIPIEAAGVRLATWNLDPDTDGQTFGLYIYIHAADPGARMTRADLKLLIHEVQHSRQYVHLHRSMANFGYYYFFNWADEGFDYFQNCMEAEARATADWHIAAAWARFQRAR